MKYKKFFLIDFPKIVRKRYSRDNGDYVDRFEGAYIVKIMDLQGDFVKREFEDETQARNFIDEHLTSKKRGANARK